MRNLFGLGLIAAAAISFGGCGPVYSTAVPSVQGRAFVSSGTAFWNCDATSGEPVCYQTKQQPQPKAK